MTYILEHFQEYEKFKRESGKRQLSKVLTVGISGLAGPILEYFLKLLLKYIIKYFLEYFQRKAQKGKCAIQGAHCR